MKLKVLKVLTKNPEFSGVSKKTGNPYTIHSWAVQGELDGHPEDYLEVKSLKSIELEIGKEYEVKEETFSGKVSYTIQSEGLKKPVSGGSGYSRPSYNMAEYDAVFDHAIEFITAKFPDNGIETLSPLISTYIISAINSGVRIEKKSDYKDEFYSEPEKTKFQMHNELTEYLKNYPEDMAEYKSFVTKHGSVEKIPEEEMKKWYNSRIF